MLHISSRMVSSTYHYAFLQDVYEPSLQRSIPYLLCVGIIGIFTLVILRKRFIIDYRLQYPSGTATGILIASFHTPKGEAAAREQVGPGPPLPYCMTVAPAEPPVIILCFFGIPGCSFSRGRADKTCKLSCSWWDDGRA